MLPELIGESSAVVAVGHTHRAFIRRSGDILVVNAGSVGLPFDGDARAAYGQVTWQNGRWQGEIIRLPYDREQARRDFHETGFLEGAGPAAELILLELETALPQLYQWAVQYEEAILAGEITMETAVQSFLASPVTTPYWLK